jgi:3-hydroxyisobutyrate dehydrogenase
MMVNGQFVPMFPVELVEKDFGYVVYSAKELGSNTPVASAVQAVYKEALQKGLGERHITAVLKLFDS